MTSPEENDLAGVAAAFKDPMLGVHVLTEFVFCPRAGLIGLEQDTRDSGDDEKPIRLDYFPRYELSEIEAAYQRAFWGLVLVLVCGAFGFVLLIGSAVFVGSWLRWVAWLGLVIFAILVTYYVLALLILTHRRSQALAARKREPVFENSEPVPVNWWELRCAGFEARRYQGPLYDDQLKLQGRPWLVLCRGKMRIPVFRQHRPTDRVYPQHFVRIAGYCHLVERSTGLTSPFGVILYGFGYDGIAIPRSAKYEALVRESLAGARRVIHLDQRGSQPTPPGNRHVCARCPVGKPKRYVAGKTETHRHRVALPVFGVRGLDNRVYHSACGDRFEWIPPHDQAFGRALRSED